MGLKKMRISCLPLVRGYYYPRTPARLPNCQIFTYGSYTTHPFGRYIVTTGFGIKDAGKLSTQMFN